MPLEPEKLITKESLNLSMIRELEMKNPLVASVLNLHRYGEITYEQALILAVKKLCDQNEFLQQQLLEVHMNSTRRSTWPLH
jgi:hypothetical protein